MVATDNTTWPALADRFAGKAFLPGLPGVTGVVGERILRPGRAKAWAGVIVLSLVISAFAVAATFLSPIFFVLMAAALLALILPVQALICRRRVRLPTNSASIALRQGWGRSDLVFAPADLEVRLERYRLRPRRKGQRERPNLRGIVRYLMDSANKYALLLAHKGAPDHPIILAKADKRDVLLAAFHALAGVIGSSADTSGSRIVGPDGREVTVSPDALRLVGANIRTCRLVILSDRVEVRPTATNRLCFAAFLAVGLAGGVGLVAAVGQGRPAWALLVGGVGMGTFTLFGAWGMLGRFGVPPIVLDTVRGVVIQRRGRLAVPELAAGLPFSRLAALQICSRAHASGGDASEGGFTAYELNAVVRDDRATRFPIMTGVSFPWMWEQAESISRIVGAPVLDDTRD